VVITAPAKLNLSLNVGSLRADGYHEVDSVFHLLSLCDKLTLTPVDEFSFSCDIDLGIPASENLIVRSAVAMAQLYNRPLPNYHLHLEKRIPHGAGLGGGSSNAAATIFALAHLWGARPDTPETLALAAQLGSDVPLFLAPTAASVMTGRGERLAQSLEPVAGLPLVVVYPRGAHSPTGEVYRAFDTDPQPTRSQDALIAELQRLVIARGLEGALTQASTDAFSSDQDVVPLNDLPALLNNNLEHAATSVSPPTREVLTWLRRTGGVQAALVAGSGSACWALCATRTAAKMLAVDAREQGWWAQDCSTAAQGIALLPDSA
jgi:4-diphosphocytidyl-2-C-methyl-D-erythritol kinase